MYDTNYECRYHKNNIFLETDNVNDLEKEFVLNVLYKEDMLNIFKIEYDQLYINENFKKAYEAISNLYEHIEDNAFFKECIRKLKPMIHVNADERTVFTILYSYDFMYLTHKCVSDYLTTCNISNDNMELLENIINNYVKN